RQEHPAAAGRRTRHTRRRLGGRRRPAAAPPRAPRGAGIRVPGGAPAAVAHADQERGPAARAPRHGARRAPRSRAPHARGGGPRRGARPLPGAGAGRQAAAGLAGARVGPGAPPAAARRAVRRARRDHAPAPRRADPRAVARAAVHRAVRHPLAARGGVPRPARRDVLAPPCPDRRRPRDRARGRARRRAARAARLPRTGRAAVPGSPDRGGELMTARRVRDVAARLLPPLCTAVVLLGLWELWVRWTDPPRFLNSAPSEIARDAVARAGELAMATWNTTVAVAWGFALSAVIGIAVGVVLSSSR